MVTHTSSKSGKVRTRGEKSADRRVASDIRFTATLRRPASPASATWSFLLLPEEASACLPSRGQVSVRGTINGSAFCATLEPDGQGGH